MGESLNAHLNQMIVKWQKYAEPDFQNVSVNGLYSLPLREKIEKKKRIAENTLNIQKRTKFIIFKQTPLLLNVNPEPRPLMGTSCNVCTPRSAGDTNNCFNTDVTNVLVEKSKFQAKNYGYSVSSKSILQDRIVQQTIKEKLNTTMQPLQNGKNLIFRNCVKKYEKQVLKIIKNIDSWLTEPVLRFSSWIWEKIVTLYLSKVIIHQGQKAWLEKGNASALPILFVTYSRSSLDHPVLALSLIKANLPCPLTATEIQKTIFPRWILRLIGAFFIQRACDNSLYQAVAESYIIQHLQAGHHIILSLDSRFSTSGRPSVNNDGLLSVIVNSYLNGCLEDALIAPVNINYEIVPDINRCQKFGFKMIFSKMFNSNTSKSSCRAVINYPFKLSEIVESLGMRKIKSYDANVNALMKNRNDKEDNHNSLDDYILKHICYDINASFAVMCTNFVAFILLTKFRDGASLDQLEEQFGKLKADYHFAQRDLGFSGSNVDLIFHAVDLLGSELVQKETKDKNSSCKSNLIFKPVTTYPNVVSLSYYSNSVLIFYILDAVVATSLCVAANLFSTENDKKSMKYVTEKEILELSLELCNLLHYEFIFSKPCESLEMILSDKVDTLKIKEVLMDSTVEEFTEEQECARRININWLVDEDEDDLDDMETKPQQYFINRNEHSLLYLDKMSKLVQPILEAYTITVSMLEKLIDTELSEEVFVEYVLTEIRKQNELGVVKYGEAASPDLVRNAIKLFCSWYVVDFYMQDNIKLYYLHDQYNYINSIEVVRRRIEKFSDKIK